MEMVRFQTGVRDFLFFIIQYNIIGAQPAVYAGLTRGFFSGQKAGET